jgi:hypothetical protein
MRISYIRPSKVETNAIRASVSAYSIDMVLTSGTYRFGGELLPLMPERR